MTRRITRRPRAEADTVELWSYVADHNEAAADRLLRKIDDTLKMLLEHPQAGRARPELRADLRSFPVKNYIIFYLPTSAGVEVVRVLSGHLDIDQDDVE